MTDQNTNGAVRRAASDAPALGQRAAELSAQMVRPQSPDTPEITAAELGKRMELIREVKRTQMREGIDYGTVPGTDKPGLFKPGAEKLAVLFRLDVQPSNEPIWGPGEHLTVISRATVYHIPTGARLGYGEGICSSRERNRAYRKQERTCPNCGAAAVIKGKAEYGGGYVCWKKRDGCGANFPDGDERIEGQEVGEIKNPDLPDTWNPVTKMAKKRAVLDAVMSVTGASAIFTQDLGADPTEMAAPEAPHGPVVPAELRQTATQAAIRLCGGEPARAKALWEQIQAALEGYMPEAAATTLVLVAQAEAPPGATAAGQQTPAVPEAPGGETQDPPPATTGRPVSSSTRNPHGTRLHMIAGARGVGDADLANLIRNAVGQAPIPTDRARAALPTILERISEEISDQTVGLLEMFYPPPPGDDPQAATGEVTSVDFGAIEPPPTR